MAAAASGSRRLERVQGLSAEAKAAFARGGFSSCGEVLGVSELELVDRLDLYLSDVRELLGAVAASVCPRPATALQVLQRRGVPRTLRTGIDPLDAHLGGGLRPGSITEFVGLAGVGKTEMCLALTAQARPVVPAPRARPPAFARRVRPGAARRPRARRWRRLHRHGRLLPPLAPGRAPPGGPRFSAPAPPPQFPRPGFCLPAPRRPRTRIRSRSRNPSRSARSSARAHTPTRASSPPSATSSARAGGRRMRRACRHSRRGC